MRLIKTALMSLLIAGSSVVAKDQVWEPVDQQWSFSNPIFGKYDRAQLQRGFQVHKEVCSSCHSLKQVAIRDLTGIGLTVDEVKALAKGYTHPDIDPDTGETIDRPGLPTDYFSSPYANDEAAKAANNGAAPPDLSLVVKAREGGAPYVFSILTGYHHTPPKTLPNSEGKSEPFVLTEGQNYNPYFPGMKIAMARQLEDGKLEYADGTKATEQQLAKDVTAFLMWTAEPKLEQRRQMGISVLIFMSLLIGLTYVSYKRVWKDVK